METEKLKQSLINQSITPINVDVISNALPEEINDNPEDSISLISNNTNIITAQDIDDSKNNIENIIERKLIEFNKLRIRRKLKEIRDQKRIEYNNSNYQLPEEEKTQLKKEIIFDKESEKFKKQSYIDVKIQQDNYYEIRQIVNGLNDLNEFSSEIEKHDIQRIDNFLTYRELFKQATNNIPLYTKMLDSRKNQIVDYIQTLNNPIFLEKIKYETEENILSTIQKLYEVTKDVDDIELYEKFNLQSNIDFSNKLSDIMFYRSYQNNNNNPINDNDSNKTGTFMDSLIRTEIISNKLFGNLLCSSNGKNKYFVSTNKITCMDTMFITSFTNKKVYSTRTLGELLLSITDTKLKSIDKALRQQIYATYDGTRPNKEEYYKWNGLQIYDIDLKEWKMSDGSSGNIDLLKQELFNQLSEFHWFLWICKSASGKGIHIYTKVSPPHHVFVDLEKNEYISAYWYMVNYISKLSVVYDCLHRLNNDSDKIEFPNQSFENTFVDNTVGRITSGIRLTYDSMPLVNHNFVDLHPSIMLSQTLDGVYYQKTINDIFFRDTKTNNKFIQVIDEDLCFKDSVTKESKKSDGKVDLTKFVSLGGDITNVIPLSRNQINYMSRYNVCNTLAAMFGKEGLQIAHRLLDSTVCKNVGEINSFYSCALSNKKTASKIGIEILKKSGIIKDVKPEVKTIIDDKYKSYIKKQIEKSLDNLMQDYTFELSRNEYISDKSEELKSLITGEKINILLSPPNSGKTEFIKHLARSGKKVLLVLPFISVIQNKIETDAELMKIFDCYYGSKNVKDIDYGINAVTTFDKFSKANYEKISKIFDYIIIDESHLLFISSYRIEATAQAVKKIKDLYYISSNDPFSAKILLMTGTETGESYFFDSVANIIRITKPLNNKEMEFLICNDNLDALTRLSAKAAQLLKEDYRLMIPTNKGEIYTEKLIGMIEHIVDKPLKYGYYKRSNTEQEICKLINEKNSIGDYDIVFCSNYLSVGIDINDKGIKFASLYLGNFSGYEIEQFNARIRKIGIRSIYTIVTNKNDGTLNEVLLEEPNLVLHLTDEDKVNFVDDKNIAGAKTEFLASYDPVLRKITTPGFSLLNGKIQFNVEEYELTSFEIKYSECMEHPIKVARELAKYGYHITVSTEFEGLSLADQEQLKKIGIASAKEEKLRKHNLLVGIFIELLENNSYKTPHGLEFTDVINFIMKNPDLIKEDRELRDSSGEILNLRVDFDLFATPIAIVVRSKEAMEKMIGSARYLIKKYSVTKAKEIFLRYVDESGILKQKLFQRSINLLKLVDGADANELADPIVRTIEKIHDYVDKFENSSDYRVTFDAHRSFLELLTNEYISLLGIKINTKYGFDKIQDSIVEMMQDIAIKSTSAKGIKFVYNKLPDQNSNSVLNRRTVDSIVENMFKVTGDLIREKNKIRRKHIILSKQDF